MAPDGSQLKRGEGWRMSANCPGRCRAKAFEDEFHGLRHVQIAPLRRRARASPRIFAAAALIGAAPARAQAPQEDTNPLNSVLGFVGMQFDKEKEDIDYRARAPLVVPPQARPSGARRRSRTTPTGQRIPTSRSAATPPPPRSARPRRSRRTRASKCRPHELQSTSRRSAEGRTLRTTARSAPGRQSASIRPGRSLKT